MHRSIAAALALIAVTGVAACNRSGGEAEKSASVEAPTPAPMQTPARKEGLWKHTMTSDGGAANTVRICTNAETEKKVAWWGGGMSQGACTENTANRGADGAWTFKSVCKGGTAGDSITEGRMTGDFSTRYEVTGSTTTQGSAIPQANGTHTISMTAEWEGPCPEGWIPGDVEVAGGTRMNTLAFDEIRKQIEAQTGQ